MSLSEIGISTMARERLSRWTHVLAAVSISAFVSHTASATTVEISRLHDGAVCNGWVVNPNIIATAAHCVSTAGHYSVSLGKEIYHVYRIWIHPEYSPELIYHAINSEELNCDVAILQIAQRDFAVEEHGHLKDKAVLPRASLFAVRTKQLVRQNAKEIEEIAYAKLVFRKNGVVISNDGKSYDICPGDSGTPLFARIADAELVVGIIVANAPGTEESCGNEIRVVDAPVILEFLQSIRRFRERLEDTR